MLAFPFKREFRLGPFGTSCGNHGLFVGPVPLLRCHGQRDGEQVWAPRPAADLNEELSLCYGVPVDIASKIGGITTVARAFNGGNLALAKIAAVQLQFPDLPPLGKQDRSVEDIAKLVEQLFWSDLLKGDWDPDKHPRTGEEPNPGRFARVPKEPKAPKPGWPLPHVNVEIRKWAREVAPRLAEKAPLAMLGPVGDIALTIETFLDTFSPTELNQGEDRAVDQMWAAADPPKSLEELQTPPKEHVLGYEQHHIVEQNDDNIKKRQLRKFGWERIDDPSNKVWVPRLKHESISAEYSSSEESDPLERRKRKVVNEMDFGAQREMGLAILRKHGVLK